jgi:uroporphyrin-III C-methyltransferase/precorrin-2 dehydrogenase/sirohydrochlorin ferrochelatase
MDPLDHSPEWLPVQIRAAGRLAVLVGAGVVAQRKAEKLLGVGARVRVIAPATPQVWEGLAVERVPRAYAGPADLEGAFLVVAATDDPPLNARIAAEARALNALVLRADDPGDSDLAFPATLRRGPLTVSFATDGLSPAYAARLKREAAAIYGPEHEERLERIRSSKAAPAFQSLPRPQRERIARHWAESDHVAVSLVGAGPGDPGLITLKAAERLGDAEVVVHDALANPELLARFAPQARHIDAGKHKGHCVLTQEQINALLIDLARQGLRVVRLKGGDPCLFGRAGEEARALAAEGIPFEIVPGVSSLSAVPAAAGIPVTDRDFGRSVGAFSLHKRNGHPPADEEWDRMARGPETLVLFMGRSMVRTACAELMARGRAPELPAALVVNGTLPHQSMVTGTLATLADRVEAHEAPGPGLIVVGEVVNLAPVLSQVLQEACPC